MAARFCEQDVKMARLNESGFFSQSSSFADVSISPASNEKVLDYMSSNSHPRLKTATRTQLRRFLQRIQTQFLEVVDPRQSGVLDHLISANLLTETDNESMSGKDVNTRKQQARKLWIFLNKMAVADFNAEVVPVLFKYYPHVIPEDFILRDGEELSGDEEVDECLRHDMIARVREATLADMLSSHDCLPLEDYEGVVTGDFSKDYVWGNMLDCFTGQPDDVTAQLLTGLKSLLEKYKVSVPDNLSQLMVRGFPCTCGQEPQAPPSTRTPLPARKVRSWVKKSPFCNMPPWSSGSHTDQSGSSRYPSTRSSDCASIQGSLSVHSGLKVKSQLDKKPYVVVEMDALPEKKESVAVESTTDGHVENIEKPSLGVNTVIVPDSAGLQDAEKKEEFSTSYYELHSGMDSFFRCMRLPSSLHTDFKIIFLVIYSVALCACFLLFMHNVTERDNVIVTVINRILSREKKS